MVRRTPEAGFLDTDNPRLAADHFGALTILPACERFAERLPDRHVTHLTGRRLESDTHVTS
ncbi:hypothetical protein [Streptosporangium sp. NBC_01756]|uniref:hypothetical protein n=1 Tax=Streptosporangium sp. NBC_01756 TaxID=2975950 RepID=UPI002DD83304|nr:hypothetical protein [Streptosporangium sp. NBC_01756]WSC88928.1 hypothetical protein OIE48_12295 [Streptosporangium sp. NBC_01756]